MRKGAFVAALALVLAGTAAAQYRGGRIGGGRTYGSPSGFGNILFPGTGTAPPIRHPVLRPSFAQRLGATVTGGHVLGPYGKHGQFGYGQPLVYPVPVYYGGYGGYGGFGGYGYPEQPPVTVLNQPAQQPAVIINQYYSPETAKPAMRDYTSGPPQDGDSAAGIRQYHAPAPSNAEPRNENARPVADQKPNIYLIAYRDGSIRGSLAYWIEADTLHYITTHGAHNRASMDLIDSAFSEQLNRERNIDFSLTVAR